MAAERCNQTLFSEFFSCVIERFGYAVGVEREGVAGGEPAFANRAIPIFEEAENGAGGIEAFESVIVPEKKSAEMPTVGIAQAPEFVIVLGKEERRIGALGSVVIEEPVHGLQKLLRLIQSDGALAAQVRLKVRHQESRGDALSGNIANYQAKALLSEI